jgi:ubiquinone/menaquinone biosynthesis C-methylase UbiE
LYLVYTLTVKIMKTNTLNFICCPACKGVLEYSDLPASSGVSPVIHCTNCSLEYSSNNGYPDFLGDRELPHKSKWEKTIKDLYARYYTATTDFMFFFLGGAKNAREEVLSLLDLTDDAIILETGMGPGDNFPLMHRKARNIKIFAIDIQKQMLTHCMRNIREWKIDAELFRADAEELPFRNELFDVVFHLGAFNLFDNKKKALDEMIRVAKPGARIVIADESEKGNKIFNMITGTKIDFVLPVDLVPESMQNMIVRTIWKSYGYVIAFTKPLS